MKIKNAISPKREENFALWYQKVIKEADLAEHSCVRGAMIIKPFGFSIWENMKKILDGMIKKTGHVNAYFPLFIPLSFLEKEAKHVEGFAKECAVVTHHRLEKKGDKLIPAAELEEPYIVRPTSEMVIGDAFSRWIESYRDLPVLINQWANVVRWEMRPRLFLRTSEFLWQEGHTVHATREEALEETLKMLDVYDEFLREYLAIPSIKGEKSEKERFPGAENTYSLEAMMQDGKALQAVTSHFLGQNFSKACSIKFRDEKGDEVYGWTTSWGATTRLIGGLIMAHSDDNGLVLPPKIAPWHLVIQPVIHKREVEKDVLKYCKELKEELEKVFYGEESVRVLVDDRDIRGGDKKWEWVKKGIPLRVEIGPRDMEKGIFCLYRRDKFFEKLEKGRDDLIKEFPKILEDIQNSIFERAKSFMDKNLVEIEDEKGFYEFFKSKDFGFAICGFCLCPKMEEKLKRDLNVSVRNIPFQKKEEQKCIFTGKKSKKKVIFAKAY
jgi:prolyl-tRNA synthetase